MELKKTIGEKIVLARKAAGLSQRALAKKLNLSQQVLSGYERGISSIPLTSFIDICQILDAPISWFIPSIKQYGEIISREDIELLTEIKKRLNTKELLNFIKTAAKQSNVKK